MLMKECSQVPAVLGAKGELGLQVVLGLSSSWNACGDLEARWELRRSFLFLEVPVARRRL